MSGPSRTSRSRAPGSACCRAAASTCSHPRPTTSPSRTSPTASLASRAGTARPTAQHAFSVAQHTVLVETIAGTLNPGWEKAMAARRAPARRTGVRDRRPDQPVQGGDRLRLQGVREPAARGDPHPLRVAAQLPAEIAAAIKQADRIAAYYEATVLAGFTKDEADRYFGIPAIPPTLAKVLARLDPLPVAAAQKRVSRAVPGIGERVRRATSPETPACAFP